MNFRPRPLPCAIATMILLAGVKTADLVHAIGIGIGTSAHASSAHEEPSAEAKPAKDAKPQPSGAKLDMPSAAKSASKPADPEASKAPAEPPISDAERATLQDLLKRRKEIEARAAKLDEREAILSAAEKSLGDRVAQLQLLQTKLEGLEKERADREEENWKGLVKTYETMRPRDAATIFNDLDSKVLIQVLDRMKDTKAAPILAAMTPDRARIATIELAKYRTQATAAPALANPGAKP